jgi:hypothetical protein
MRSFASLVVAIGLGLSTVAASAMSIDPAPLKSDSAISQAAYGCGPGFTRGPAGHCRPRFTCPPGWHPGPHGFHCFRNRW